MKWAVIVLLIANLVYLGWELDRGAKALVANRLPPLKIPAGTETLKIIDETTDLQELKPVYGWQQPRRVLLPASRQ